MSNINQKKNQKKSEKNHLMARSYKVENIMKLEIHIEIYIEYVECEARANNYEEFENKYL